MTNNDHNLLKITLLQTFEGLTFTFPYLLPLLVHRPSKCRPLNIQWTTIGCILLCSPSAVWKKPHSPLVEVAVERRGRERVVKMTWTKWRLLKQVVFGVSFSTQPGSSRPSDPCARWARIVVFDVSISDSKVSNFTDRQPPNLPFRCSDMTLCEVL